MLISYLSEENNGEGPSCGDENNNSITQRDLITLYENVDTKQSSSTLKNALRTSNQHVETVIYNDPDSEDSDVSEIYSNEDLCDVILINKERIDFINSIPSLDKTLRPKSGDVAFRSDRVVNCNEDLLLKYPFLKNKLGVLNRFTNPTAIDGALLSTPLLNFIFCNHLDEGTSLFMENIIQYTRRAIDQLKRISNGDYLTDKAKEKWRTMGNECVYSKGNELAMVVRSEGDPLAGDFSSSTSKDTWRNAIHSTLDIRLLSKILEETVFVQIPRRIYGSYNAGGECCDNNLIITCKRETPVSTFEEASDSQIDIVLEITASCAQNVEFNINSLFVLQAVSCCTNESLLPIEHSRCTSTTNVGVKAHNTLTITELDEYEPDKNEQNSDRDAEFSTRFTYKSNSSDTANTISSGLCISDISSQFTFNNNDVGTSSLSSEKRFDSSDQVNVETGICITSPPDDLFCSLQKLNTQTVLLEAIEEQPLNKRKSSPKVRIKSPYENKSHAIEEMKRRKLLEIRERRERRKKIHSENCKITKYKNGKSAIMAQSTNSVTKLSISNKSFYSSIYGDNANLINKYPRKHANSEASEVIVVAREDVNEQEAAAESKINLNSNYCLDDHLTEVVNLQTKNRNQLHETDNCTPPNSAVIKDLTMNFDSFIKYASHNSSDTDLKPKNASCDSDKHDELTSSEQLHNTTSESTTNTNTNSKTKNYTKKSLMTVECRKSIDKIYELMNRLSKVETSEPWYKRRELTPNPTSQRHTTVNKNFALPTAGSGTSIKQHLNSSNPSIFSFEETNNEIVGSNNKYNKRAGAEANIISKVIISAKSQAKSEQNEIKPNKKVTTNDTENIAKNPLKAISHLINEFDQIQKSRQKAEIKDYKKNKFSDKSLSHNSFIKKATALRLEEKTKDTNSNAIKISSPNNRKLQPKTSANRGKVANQQFTNVNKNIDREKKMIDIVDEALREARGEAVRGPARPYTRLESLAQPKRVNVNGQTDRFRKGRTAIPFAAPQVSEKIVNSISPNSKLKQKRNEQDHINALLFKKQYNLSPTEKSLLRRMPNTASVDVTIPANVPFQKARTVSEITQNLKKMVPFESNLKRRSLSLTPTAASSNLLEKNMVFSPITTSKTCPPTRDSTTAAKAAHPENNLIASKLRSGFNSLPNETIKTLPIIKESKTSITYNDTKNETMPPTDNMNDDEHLSTCSDYSYDILEDKDVLTAVSNILPKNSKGKEDMEEYENNKITAVLSNMDIPQRKEVVEGIESLEKALYNHIAHGTFHKRLKIKNFTLTPKQSMNPFLLQSGDANTLLLKSCTSQTLHINPKCITEKLHVPMFRGSFANQTFPRLPFNITTVGYVFSNLPPIEYNNGNSIKSAAIQTSITLNEEQTGEKNSNDEKGVQTLVFDGAVNCSDFSAINKYKVNKSTDFNENLLNFLNNEENENTILKSEDVDDTTSLDILVELLDEIGKITKYQSSNAVDKYNRISEQLFDPKEFKPIDDNVCTADLNEQKNIIDVFNVNQCNFIDKEVTVNITKEFVNGFTDTPSQLCLIEHSCKTSIGNTIDVTIKKCADEASQYYIPSNHYEIASNLLTNTLNRTSSHSLISLYDYRAYYCNKFKDALDDTAVHNSSNITLGKYSNYSETYKNISNDGMLKTPKSGRKDNSISYFVEQKHSDAVLKMKRDILVTVYSILVFTVFAALSFPEFLYRS